MKNKNVLIIGTGNMALEYFKVLKGQGVNCEVIGNSTKTSRRFERLANFKVMPFKIDEYKDFSRFSHCIITTSSDSLYKVARHSLQYGAREILLEKPGSLFLSQLKKLNLLSKEKKANVHIAYNRRFYSSVERLLKLIKQEGGISSFSFDFSEVEKLVLKEIKNPKILNNWSFVNSTHVIDLAFFIASPPKIIRSQKQRTLNWHPKGSIYVGSGNTIKGELFSYHANWDSGGRWGLEFHTKKSKYILKPLEELRRQKRGEFTTEIIEINDRFDRLYKPGLYKQVDSFLKSRFDKMPSLQAHIINTEEIYSKILKL